jgi:RNA polymerase sigma-70 factor, ECF subfamily
MEPEQLQELIAAAQAGVGEAYETLLEAYWPRLYGYFLRATANAHEAEDLLGEMGLRLVRTLRKYDDRGRFEPWLFRIAANLVRDRIRRRKVRGTMISLSMEEESGRARGDLLPGVAPAVEARMEHAEAVDQLHESLATLDETTREMILLRHYGEMSFREIADLHDCPIGTVLAKVHRGLKALRCRMDKVHDTRRQTI